MAAGSLRLATGAGSCWEPCATQSGASLANGARRYAVMGRNRWLQELNASEGAEGHASTEATGNAEGPSASRQQIGSGPFVIG